jgi:type III pantothenate kinase
MILLLDAGNTRVKWAWLEYLEIAPAGAVAHDATHRSWQREIEADGHRPERIVVSNVAGPAFAAALTLWARDHYAVEPHFVIARPMAHGITNGYLRPETLGVDRWLALIAAWRAASTAALVVNSGTALAIDTLDERGHHRGGLILPGLQMLLDASGPAPAQWTSDATPLLAEPIPELLAATIDRAYRELARQIGGTPRLLLTGGDAHKLAQHLETPPDVVQDLVLTGLAIAATDGATHG